jgi:plasmid replication initiation protein
MTVQKRSSSCGQLPNRQAQQEEVMQEKSQCVLAIKANRLIEANYRLSLTEQRIIFALCSKISPEDRDFQPYTFRVPEFMELAGIQDKSKYSVIPSVCARLMKRVLTITEGKSVLVISWISSARHETGSGEVILSFDPNLKPYLLQLKAEFTRLTGRDFLKLRSCYAQRIYELLKQYEGLGQRKFSLADLRKKLGIQDSEYKLYADFKRKVILVAQRQLQRDTSIAFDFEEIKESRKVAALLFTIRTNSQQGKESRSASGRVAKGELKSMKKLTRGKK